ncbi:MAG: DUF3179 domain-containing protein [Acidobacteriota bacterium]
MHRTSAFPVRVAARRPPAVLPAPAAALLLLLALIVGLLASAPASANDPLTVPTAFAPVLDLMSDKRKVRKKAVDRIAETGDLGLVPGIVDALFFIPRTSRTEAFRALEALTADEPNGGKAVDRSYWDWIAWTGAREDIAPTEGYFAWKRLLLMRIDRRFAIVFYDGAPTHVRLEEVVSGGVGLEGIPALDNPTMIAADEARYLRGKEDVFGVVLGGEARAYPVRHLSWHEMLNDVVGGVPVTLSYCTLCGSAILYDGRAPGGGTRTFGTSGLLYRSNKLMIDRQSLSLWHNITGEAVVGRAAVARKSLDILPMTRTTWKAWSEAHPDTLVLAAKPDPQRPNLFDYRPGAADRARAGVRFPVWKRSEAMPDKTEIYALTVEGRAKAWSLEALYGADLVHDRVGEIDLVLITDEAADAVRVYRRDGRTFTRDGDGLADGGGANWQITEAALVGPDGANLARVPGHVAFWFGWYAFYPQTEIWDGSE